jgi:NTE family protein
VSKKADVVLEGGGVKAVGLVGALNYAESLGYYWNNVAGTSAGAIVGALLVAGYSGSVLKDIVFNMDFTALADKRFIQRLPLVGPLAGLGLYMGLYRGDALEQWIRKILADKGVGTFGDLRIHDEHNPRYRYRLQVIASDLTLGRMLVLPDDIKAYGLDPDSMEVAQAVRMSAGIPFFYEPMMLRYGRLGHKGSYVVDGGLLSNYPVWLFDCPKDRFPRWPTIGLRLVDPRAGQPSRITGPLSLLTALFSTMLEAHDARHIKEANFVRTIPINTLGVRTVDFNIPPSLRHKLYESGVSAAKKFFATWDFTSYKNQYRQPEPLARLTGPKGSSTTGATHCLS